LIFIALSCNAAEELSRARGRQQNVSFTNHELKRTFHVQVHMEKRWTAWHIAIPRGCTRVFLQESNQDKNYVSTAELGKTHQAGIMEI